MDVIEWLTLDHERLNRLLEQLNAEDRPAETEAIFEHVAAALAAHEAAEEEAIFPAVRATLPVGEDAVFDLLDEHKEVNQLVAAMREMNPTDFGFVKRVSALILELQEHLAEEEKVLLPLLRSSLDRQQLLELAERVQARASPPTPPL